MQLKEVLEVKSKYVNFDGEFLKIHMENFLNVLIHSISLYTLCGIHQESGSTVDTLACGSLTHCHGHVTKFVK